MPRGNNMKIETRFTRKKLSSNGGRAHLEVTLTPPEEPRDKRPVCVVMAIDMCDEMSKPDTVYRFTEMYTPIISHVRLATNELISDLGEEDIFGCVVFNHRGFICQELIHPVSKMVPDIKLQVSRIIPHGGRKIAEGLKLAGKIITDRVASNYKCQIILVTNGKSTPHLAAGENLAGQCEALRERGIKVNLVGCNSKYSLEDFIAMTEAGGGNGHHVQNYEHLEEIFREETETLRNESAKDVRLIIRSESPLKIGGNLNGYPQKNKDGKSEVFIGGLCEPLKLHFEIRSEESEKSFAEMEFAAVFKETGSKACKKTVFETMQLTKEEVCKQACNVDVLRAWLMASVVGSIREACLNYNKCKFTKMDEGLKKAKEETRSLCKIYPDQVPLVEKSLKTMEQNGKIFFVNKLGIGENKAAYFESIEILRRNSKKTIDNLYI